MIQFIEAAQATQVGTLVLRPNQSMTWRATLYFIGLLALVSLTIAVSFTAQGYWLILPFTLIELIAISACFYYLLQRSQRQQVIEFFTDAVHISSGRRAPETAHVCERYFTKIFVKPARHAWYAPKVLLKHKQDTVELGEFLTANEKQELIRHLHRLVQLANERQVNIT